MIRNGVWTPRIPDRAGSTAMESGALSNYEGYGNQTAGPSLTPTSNPYGYDGYYTDAESGLCYLNNRYYDPTTQRFTQQDPALDGGNWYGYCGGDPINNWDPTGLRIVLKGTSDQKKQIMDYLKLIPMGTLSYDSSGVVSGKFSDSYIGPAGKLWRFPNGEKLIKRLISSAKTVTIQIGTGGNSCSYSNPGASNGKGCDATVSFNPSSNPDILTVEKSTGNVRKAKRPSYIGLAHELIHADHVMRGVMKTGNADYKYQIGRTKHRFLFWTYWSYTYAIENVPKEELSTIGLAYSGDITENQIRAEHGLELRGAY